MYNTDVDFMYYSYSRQRGPPSSDKDGRLFPFLFALVPHFNTLDFLYCLWVPGSFKDKGYGKALLEYCIADAEKQNKSGVCVISSKKKKPFLPGKNFMQKFGFKTVDTIDDEYELMALSFDGSKPQFANNAKKQSVEGDKLTVYCGLQSLYIPNCIGQIEKYCIENRIPVDLIKVDTLEKAKALPCAFNHWTVFYKGRFKTVHLPHEAYLKKKSRICSG